MNDQKKGSVFRRLGAIGAVASALAGVVGVAFSFWPNLNPLSAHAGEIKSVDLIEYNVPYGGYLGNEYAVKVNLKGYNGKTNPVYYTVRNIANGTAVPGMTDQLAFEHVSEGQDETAIGKAWVPVPASSGQYYVEFTLYDNDGETVLDRRNSISFSS